MPVIQPRTRGKRFARIIVRLDVANDDTLCAYAAFIDEPVDYVVNQLVEVVLARDKDYLRWRADHPDSFTQRPAAPAVSAAAPKRQEGARQQPERLFTPIATRTNPG